MFIVFVFIYLFLSLRKKGQGGVIQGGVIQSSARVVCITEIYGIVGSSNCFPLKITIFCHLLKVFAYNYGTNS